MKYNPDIHHRRSIRLKDYDYAQAGMYFVTIVTQNRECLFGDVQDGKRVLNDAGDVVKSVWDEMPEYYTGVGIDECIIMPNHLHGIVAINNVGAGPRACPQEEGHPQGGAPTLSLPDVVHRFKSLSTTRYSRGIIEYGWPPFNGKLWQRNYYEHIIPNEEELNTIREYIANNPIKWDLDKENPAVIGREQ